MGNFREQLIVFITFVVVTTAVSGILFLFDAESFIALSVGLIVGDIVAFFVLLYRISSE